MAEHYGSAAAGEDICWTYMQKGYCPRGAGCRWEHRQVGEEHGDMTCRAWLLWGQCPRGDTCQWAHPVQQPEVMYCPQVPVIGIVQGLPLMQVYCPGSYGTDYENCYDPSYYNADDGTQSNDVVQPSKDTGFDCDAFFQNAREAEISSQKASSNNEDVLPDATLEEQSNVNGSWDQFEANRTMFGVTSTFNEDLSQYTTELNVSRVPMPVQKKADRIANEIKKEHQISGRQEDDYLEAGCDDVSTEDDEEARFSAVAPKAEWATAPAIQCQ